MKHFFSLLFVFCTILTFGQTTKKAFFIGNSYTAYNTMPAMVNSIAQSRGNTLIHNQRTPDGETLEGHAQAAQTTTLMNSDNWDFVIIQEQSQLGAYPSSAFANNGLLYGTQLANSAKNNGAIPLFYRTWGKKEGDTYFCNIPYATDIYCAYDTMDYSIDKNYRLMAESNAAWLGPVGNVFRYLRTNNPEIELYNADKSHPSVSGSYVAALTFYTLMFNDNPETVTYTGSVSSVNAAAIKAAVKQIVYDNMTEWTSVGPSDNIISVSAPTAVSPGKTVSVQVNYSATQQRDIVVVFQEQNTPFTGYGESRTTVDSGSGFVNIDVIIDAATPLADSGYEYVVYVVPFGQTIDQAIDSGVVSNVTCASVVVPTIDQVTITSWPSVLTAAQTYDVTVDYSVTESRDIRLILQYVGDAPITVDGVEYLKYGWPIQLPAQTVSAGTGSLVFTVLVDPVYPDSIDLHHWVSWITNVGGGWTESIASANKKFGIDIEPSLSISEKELENKLFIYPNPAGSYLNIQLSQPGAIQILSLDGKLLLKTKVESAGLTTIDISNLESGLYFIKSVENSFKPVKFIKK